MNKPSKAQLEELAKLGVGTSIYQLSAPSLADLGTCPNQWDLAANKTVPLSRIQTSAWDTILNYLPILKQFGFSRIRFSLEWNYIEPIQGQFNEDALAHYAFIIQQCHAHGIEPMLTLYHFTHPAWFEALGGFEKEENIAYFIQYCSKAFTSLSPYAKLWCSINEPAVIAFSAYLYGQFPPHKRLRLNLASQVLRNLLKAHVDVCQMVEEHCRYSDDIKIGLVHNVLRFESRSKIIHQCLTGPLTEFTDDSVLNFLKTGHFEFRNIKYYDSRFKGNCCYVNIYGNVQINYLGPTCQSHQKMGDMYIAIYPESYSLALERAASLGLPIYITETGIADQSDELRPEFIIEILTAVMTKVQQGYDVQGIYFWTFKDNYEWNQGNNKHFGLFTESNHARNSAYLWSWLINKFRTELHKPHDAQKILSAWTRIIDYARQKIKNHDLVYFRKKQ